MTDINPQPSIDAKLEECAWFKTEECEGSGLRQLKDCHDGKPKSSCFAYVPLSYMQQEKT